MDEAWVEQWRDDMRSTTAALMSTFAARFGYPPGEHEVSDPAGEAELRGEALPEDLLTLYRVVAEVRLPDVGNGYWIHRPPQPGDDPGHPRRLSDGRAITVFGSDGGGALFALPATPDAPVLRLSGGAYLDGAYDAAGATVIAANLQEFLTDLSRESSITGGANPA